MPDIDRRKITKRLIDAASSPSGDDIIIWDTQVSGFRVRLRSTGRKVYEVRYRTEGSSVQRQITIGRHGSPWTPEGARERAKAILYAASQGLDPLATRRTARASLTVAALCERYLREGPAHKPTKRESSWEVDRYSFNHHLIPVLGHRIAKSLNPADLAEWQAKVATGGTARRLKSEKPRGVINVRGGLGAAARAMRSTAAMLAWAKSMDLVETNPAERVVKIPDGRRERYLSDEEAAAIWRTIDALLAERRLTMAQACFFRLLMLTGARRGEILHLRWSEVDIQRRLLLLPPARHKSGGAARPKTVHLSPAAIELLVALRGEQPRFQHVFPMLTLQRKAGNRDGEAREAAYEDKAMAPPKSAWCRILTRSGVTDAPLHVLRHTFASQVIETGETLYTLSKMLGHARSTTTERYAHLRADPGVAAAQRIADRYETFLAKPAKASAT